MIYKFLDIPEYRSIADKVYAYIVNNTDIISTNAFWNWTNQQELLAQIPELKLALDNLHLEVQRISIVKVEPKQHIRIHIDWDKEPRILWPIRNCQGSHTKFFKIDPDNVIEQRGVKGDTYYLITRPELAEQIDSLELTAPVVFTPGVAHGVWPNPDYNEPRLTMTIKFKTDTDFAMDLEKYNLSKVDE
jgi:hypothetical protein